jgi:Domain of unknown function (DUF4169)
VADPINLNKFRKAKAKAEKDRLAKENRAKFGRTKSDKSLEAARADKARRETDAHRRGDDPEDRG